MGRRRCRSESSNSTNDFPASPQFDRDSKLLLDAGGDLCQKKLIHTTRNNRIYPGSLQPQRRHSKSITRLKNWPVYGLDMMEIH
jgi:hypothetical protein